MIARNILEKPESTGLRGDALAAALRQAAQEDPETAVFLAKNYMSHIPEPERSALIERAAQLRPTAALWWTESYMPFVPPDKRHDILKQAALLDPLSALGSVKDYITYVPPDKRVEFLRDAVRLVPETAIDSAPSYLPLIPPEQRTAFLRDIPANPYIKFAYFDKSISLLLEAERASYAESVVDSAEDHMVGVDFKNMTSKLNAYISPASQDRLQMLYEKRSAAFRMGRTLNDGHNLPEAERFAPINNYTPQQLYELIVFGRDEVFTSTYMGVVDRLVDKLKETKQNLADVANPRYGTSMPVFLEAAASYNRLDKVLPLIPAQQWPGILEKFEKKIGSKDTSYAVALADIMQKVPDPGLKAQMEQFVQQRYDAHAAIPGPASDLYGVLGAYYNSTAGSARIRLNQPERYSIVPQESLSNEALRGPDGVHRQLVVFSEDKDGKNSYASFLKRYQNNDKYRIDDRQNYVAITPTHGEKMAIYANKPGQSPDAIVAALQESDPQHQKPAFDMVVHRGHSYNLMNTMPYFSSTNALAFLGSCGGYNNVDQLLKTAPDVQVIATKETGTMAVNDPLLYHINEKIRTGQPVVWKDARKYIDGFDSAHKSGYVLPDWNTTVLMQKRLKQLERARVENSANEPRPVVGAADRFNTLAPGGGPVAEEPAPVAVALNTLRHQQRALAAGEGIPGAVVTSSPAAPAPRPSSPPPVQPA